MFLGLSLFPSAASPTLHICKLSLSQRKWSLTFFSASGKSRNPEYVSLIFFFFSGFIFWVLFFKPASILSPLSWSKPACYLKDQSLAINIDKLCNGWSQSTNTEVTIGITGLVVSQGELDQLNPNSSYFYKPACFQPLGIFKYTNYFNVASQPAWHRGKFTLALRLLCACRFELSPRVCMSVLNFECT